MEIEPVQRYVLRNETVIPFKTLEKASEEAAEYKFSRISKNHYACKHDNVYIIIEKDGAIGCSCAAMTFAHDNDVCKHIAAFLKRSSPPTELPSAEILAALKEAGWTGLSLMPPETTSDPDGESNDGSDPVPENAPKPTPPKIGEKVWRRECPHCGKLFEGTNLDEVKRRHQKHIAICPKRPKGGDTTQQAEPEQKQEEEAKMETEQKKTYVHPDGTEFESAEALLSYAEKSKEDKAASPARRRLRHKAMIKGISPRLQEIGRIAIGEKGGRSKNGKSLLPTKLDHFIFTTLNKDEEDRYIRDPEMMGMFGDNCTEIPIRLLYNDIELNFPTFYAKYARSGIKLRGDGENWTVYNGDGSREEVFDPNNERGFLDDPDVKPHGILTVLVEGQNSVGGVFKFRTTSWNSINNILSSLALIKNMCGMLTYIPLKLVLRKKDVQPIGMAHKTWIPVVSVEFRGSIEELQTQAIEVRKLMSGTQREEMQQIEAAVREHLDEDETLEMQRDVASEFAPGVM